MLSLERGPRHVARRRRSDVGGTARTEEEKAREGARPGLVIVNCAPGLLHGWKVNRPLVDAGPLRVTGSVAPDRSMIKVACTRVE